jgi:hypothetical protein
VVARGAEFVERYGGHTLAVMDSKKESVGNNNTDAKRHRGHKRNKCPEFFSVGRLNGDKLELLVKVAPTVLPCEVFPVGLNIWGIQP